jgi:hypothetical protein
MPTAVVNYDKAKRHAQGNRQLYYRINLKQLTENFCHARWNGAIEVSCALQP